MQKWEYCHLSFGDVVQHSVYMKSGEVSYQTIPREEDTNPTGSLCLLSYHRPTGRRSWEMVGSARSEGGVTDTVWMKRPLT